MEHVHSLFLARCTDLPAAPTALGYAWMLLTSDTTLVFINETSQEKLEWMKALLAVLAQTSALHVSAGPALRGK